MKLGKEGIRGREDGREGVMNEKGIKERERARKRNRVQ